MKSHRQTGDENLESGVQKLESRNWRLESKVENSKSGDGWLEVLGLKPERLFQNSVAADLSRRNFAEFQRGFTSGVTILTETFETIYPAWHRACEKPLAFMVSRPNKSDKF